MPPYCAKESDIKAYFASIEAGRQQIAQREATIAAQIAGRQANIAGYQKLFNAIAAGPVAQVCRQTKATLDYINGGYPNKVDVPFDQRADEFRGSTRAKFGTLTGKGYNAACL